eukprot:m51a1_g10755 putative phenylalanine--trna ligase beta subunit (600) ;mRNA; f:382544-385979
MPTVNVIRDELFALIGETFTAEQFEQLCFEFGIEFDGETTEKTIIAKERRLNEADVAGSEEILYKIEVPANRYDLLSVEGLGRALAVFRGHAKPVTYRTTPATTRMVIRPEVLGVRKFIVCAILRGIKFTPRSYRSFIDLQDKLHFTLCKRRSLASIGTHDLDAVQAPFAYEARKPSDIKFVPLRGSETAVDGAQLMQVLEADQALRDYLPLIRERPLYPAVYDARGEVMSLPPIINGSYSKISLDTRNVFIEVTATDFTKANIVLNTVACLFSEYCNPQFTVEQVEIVNTDGTTFATPDLACRDQQASLAVLNRSLGLSLDAAEALRLIGRMGMTGEARSADTLVLRVPATRSDILHECDVVEDLAIAYGFNNLKPVPTPTPTVGHQLLSTKLSDLVAIEMASAGYCEVCTWALCTVAENFEKLNRPNDNSSVLIANSKSAEFENGRTTLLGGMLRCVASNKGERLPVRIFELGDVILRDAAHPVGARNERRLCAIYSGLTSGFERVHGLLDRLMQILEVKPRFAYKDAVPAGVKTYALRPSSDPAFVQGLCAEVLVEGRPVGTLGVVHPTVLERYGIMNPCSAFEVNLEFPTGLYGL